ncbi:H-NS family nucleoid-associated regulatory protein [Janthinobacterium sp. HLX7-2]
MYRNPDNHEQQWSGRGRQPLWVKAWQDKHQSLDGLRIQRNFAAQAQI